VSGNGDGAFWSSAWPAWRTGHDARDRALFPPQVEIEIKALACSLPSEYGVPLSRFSNADIAAEAMRRDVVASISGTTVWRWLSADAIKPWTHRSRIWPRDHNFVAKAGPVLDLVSRNLARRAPWAARLRGF